MMNRTLIVSATALALIIPTLLLAQEARANDISTSDGSLTPAAGVTDGTQVEVEALSDRHGRSSRGATRSSPARAMVQRQRFNHTVHHTPSSSAHTSNPSHNNGTPAKPPKNASRALARPNAPQVGQGTQQPQPSIPTTRTSLNPGGNTPSGPGSRVGDGGRDRSSEAADQGRMVGDRGGAGNGDRGYQPQPSVGQPGYAAQPRPQPRLVKDDPVCVQGTWVMQLGQKKYVCLSWHFRGELFTPDQLDVVLARLGRPRPARLGS